MKDIIISSPVWMRCSDCHTFIDLILVDNAGFVSRKEVMKFMNTNALDTICSTCYYRMDHRYKNRQNQLPKLEEI